MKKVMKYLLEFKQYHNQKLNEGGGAGKNFEFDDISYDIKFEYTKDGLKLISKSVELGEKFDLIGYMDGSQNIPTEGLFETDIEYTFSEEKLGNVTVGQVYYFVGEDALFQGYPKETTLKEIIEKEEKIDIQVSGSGSVEHMYGAGWLTPSMEKGTEISIDITDISGEFSIGDYIDDVNVQGLLFPYVYFAKDFQGKSPDFSASIVLKATQQFADEWEDLLRGDNYDDDENENIKYENEVKKNSIKETNKYDRIVFPSWISNEDKEIFETDIRKNGHDLDTGINIPKQKGLNPSHMRFVYGRHQNPKSIAMENAKEFLISLLEFKAKNKPQGDMPQDKFSFKRLSDPISGVLLHGIPKIALKMYNKGLEPEVREHYGENIESRINAFKLYNTIKESPLVGGSPMSPVDPAKFETIVSLILRGK